MITVAIVPNFAFRLVIVALMVLMVLSVCHDASLRMMSIIDDILNFWPSFEEARPGPDQACRSIFPFWLAVTTQEEVMRLLNLQTAFSLPFAHQLLHIQDSATAEKWVRELRSNGHPGLSHLKTE
jgi:hypothetical protein